MGKIGILAYGSLIENPGEKLEALIANRIEGVKTPFSIEFARTSSSRSGAPTVIPVEGFGASVNATILVLKEDIEANNAKELLWRRETGINDSSKHYTNHENPTVNQVVVEEIRDFHGVELVLYTKIGQNIDNLSPEKLAELAISSAKEKAGLTGQDGISYLMSLKRQNIETPFMKKYEELIIKFCSSKTLEESLKIIKCV